ncbi:MAG: glycosyltransferase family 9 protein [Candidatus Adiutricales bacterium]
MNILIVKLSHIGDVAMSLPFLVALRQIYPQDHLTWLVEEAAAEIVTDHPLLDRVVVSRRKAWIREIKRGRFWEVIPEIRRFFKELRQEPYDMVIDLQGLFKSGILAYFSGAERRIGYDQTREFSYRFLNERLSPYDPDRRSVLKYLDVAAYLGVKIDETGRSYLPCLAVNEAAAREADLLFAGDKRPKVIINPISTGRNRLWPESCWKELIHLIVREYDFQVVLTGGLENQDENHRIAQGSEHVLNLTGRTSLKVLAEIIRSAIVFISPDTGPLHIAAMAGIPTVALFGPTAPWRNGPFGPGHEVIRLGIECSPCFKKVCDNPRCMTEISVDQVYQAVKRQLGSR